LSYGTSVSIPSRLSHRATKPAHWHAAVPGGRPMCRLGPRVNWRLRPSAGQHVSISLLQSRSERDLKPALRSPCPGRCAAGPPNWPAPPPPALASCCSGGVCACSPGHRIAAQAFDRPPVPRLQLTERARPLAFRAWGPVLLERVHGVWCSGGAASAACGRHALWRPTCLWSRIVG